MERYGMFTTEGDQLVGRIVDAAVKAHTELGDSVQVAWQFLYANLRKLSYAEGYGEATDTEVREICAGALEQRTGKQLTSTEYWNI